MPERHVSAALSLTCLSPVTSPAQPTFIKRLLWIDCIGAILAGIAVIALSGWLSRLEGLPQGVLLFTGAVNLLYGSYSLSLAIRARRPVRSIKLLAIANIAWAPVCLVILATYSATVTPFAVAHLAGEALYVAGLGVLEWRNRDLLASAGPAAAPNRASAGERS